MKVPSLGFPVATAVLALALGGCSGGNDTPSSEVRVLNVSADYDSVTLYVDGTARVSDVASGTVSSYAAVDEDTYDFEFRRSGAAGALNKFSDKVLGDKHRTYVAFGVLGSFSSIAIDEDQETKDIDDGDALMSVVNAAPEVGALDVYLTDASAALTDSTPTLGGVAGASASKFTTIDAGTYRLRVTAPGSKTDVRLDVSGVAFASKEIKSVILSATRSGVLVNATLLPQQGGATVRSNPNARVRAAVGLQSAQTVTAQIGGVTLVSSVAPSTVGNYRQVQAGTQAVNLVVDSTSVSVPAQSLTAGRDYTLLTWNDGAAVSYALLDDDNRRPTSGSAKVRLVHGMSLLSDPLSLAVDFSPLAEGIARGTASSPTELTATSESRVDVTNANTAVRVYTQTGSTFQDQGVYSMFVFGSAASPVGVLRKDR